MTKKLKIIKGTPKIITQEAKKLARQLHKDEHFIMNGEIEVSHKLDDWYYLMASGLITELRNDIKELSKQQKYLWQTLEEVIDKLKSLGEKDNEVLK